MKTKKFGARFSSSSKNKDQKRDELEVVDFQNTYLMELSGGEFRISRFLRMIWFGFMLGLSFLQMVQQLYNNDKFQEIILLFDYFDLIFVKISHLKFLFPIVSYGDLFLCLFRVLALYTAFKRDSDPENENKNPSAPVLFQLLVHFSTGIFCFMILFSWMFTIGLDKVTTNSTGVFKELQGNYSTDLKAKLVMDRFQITQRCCSVAKDPSRETVWHRWIQSLGQMPDPKLSNIAQSIKKSNPVNYPIAPYSCCNLTSLEFCDFYVPPHLKDDSKHSIRIRVFNTPSCDDALKVLVNQIGQTVELLLVIRVFVEFFNLIIYNVLWNSISDEIINVQRPSIVRFPLFPLIIFGTLCTVYLFFGIKHLKFFGEVKDKVEKQIKKIPRPNKGR